MYAQGGRYAIKEARQAECRQRSGNRMRYIWLTDSLNRKAGVVLTELRKWEASAITGDM